MVVGPINSMTAQNMKRWISHKQVFDSPDWTFLLVVFLLSVFLFLVLHKTYIRGVFDLTNWPQRNGQLTEQFATQLSLGKSDNKKLAVQQQRILYPTLVYIAALGAPAFVPALLVFANYIGLCVMSWLGGLYAQSLKRHAVWGVLIPLYPGFLTSLRSYSPEILEICFLLGSLLCLRRSRNVLATVLLSLAVLTKESALLMAVAAAGVFVFERHQSKKTIRWFYFTVPITIFALWQAKLFTVWGSLPLRNNQREIGAPLVGFVRLLKAAVVGTDTSLFTIVLPIGLAALFVFAVIQMQVTELQLHEKVALCLYGCWLFCLNGYIFNVDLNFLGAASEFYLMAITGILLGKFNYRVAIAVGVILLWICYAVSLAGQFL